MSIDYFFTKVKREMDIIKFKEIILKKGVFRCWLLVLFAGITAFSNAEMQPLGDADLSEISGQAYVALDNESLGNYDYIRASLGMEINTQLNIDEIKLGEYHRWENGEPCFECTGSEPGLEQQPADIWVKNFSLGAIAETSGIAMDGKYYDAGEIIPFQLFDPYFEAVSENGEIIGFRAGVHRARGIFGGDIKSLTGNIPIKIRDTASALTDAPNRPWWIGLGGALLGNTPVESQASLVSKPQESNGQVNYSTGGQPDLVRATHIGLPNNSNFSIGPIPFIGNINFKTTDCNLFGIPTCFPLSQFKSLNVGEKQPDNTFDPASGWFLSFQKKPVEWIDPVDHSRISAPTGAFFNVPVGGVELTLDEAFNGVERQRVEYIDRANGLF